MPNILGFAQPFSGPSIENIQVAVNSLYTATGVSESSTGTVYNATPGTISNGDNYQTALSTLANKFDAATGHSHDGSPGDGGPLSVVTSIAASGNMLLVGDVLFAPGSGVQMTQSGQTIFVAASGAGLSHVDSIAASGSSPLIGNILFQQGTGVQLSQVGQNIMISASGAGGASPLTTKGDLYTYSSTNVRLPIGANGTVLTANSVATTGNNWIAPNSEISTTLTSDYSQSSATISTFYIPNNAFTVAITPGVWVFTLTAFYQFNATAVAGNSVTTSVQLGTSTTPGASLILDRYRGFMQCVTANNFQYFSLCWTTKEYTASVNTNIYVNIVWDGFSGVLTNTNFGFRSNSGSGDGINPILTARKIREV